MAISKPNGHNPQSGLALKPLQRDHPPKGPQERFDQSVILEQSPVWSRAIVWVIVGVTTSLIVWASVAKIEEAIPATGKLEPQGTVKEVQPPVGGLVKAVHVKDGQRVKQGDLLLSLDPAAAQAQQTASNKIRAALVQENQFYRSQLNGSIDPNIVVRDPRAGAPAQLQLPSELVALTKSRAGLVAENRLFRAELEDLPTGNLSLEQRSRLQTSQAEFSSRSAAAQLEVGQLQRQLSQNQVQLASARDVAGVNRGILNDIEPLVKQGAIARLQYLRQQQEVGTAQAEVDQLIQEQSRLGLAIAQAKEQLLNTVALSDKDLLTQIAANEKAIAEIDGQLSKAIVENDKQLTEIDSQLSQTKLTLQYQELRAPVSGTVFDLKASSPGFVANASQPVLKIVPDDSLVAKVLITNKDVGFVREGMDVDVRVDSFPFSEFGDIKGRLVSVGSDALPPDEITPFYTFPAKIKMDQQFLAINEREIPLQSGMSITANIKVRERTVMSIFTDLFTRQVESLKSVR